ncbi:peptidoglycan recognition protein family protein [Nostoc sp. CMAA1605]|uniref:peptidoglycan recognition protein family protein n=1 Tax=Nostoc sp. CMAA1605 TaxID=2055159 RepID=UPI001F415BD2|nr:N-acetylmuramoyl-L-alanine amidase [Nostoc sp. CMAA1605]MCF4966903.1 N-acetylmuramoyl-L-alanine amidase [Nostoc sp. CMAA1605]
MAFTAKVITTEEWGAISARSFERTVPKFIVIHHTNNQNPPNDSSKGTVEGGKKLARDIQKFHIDGNGWSDSGHNFLNTTGGVLLEGRHGTLNAVKQGMCVRSAHAKQDGNRLAGGNQSPGIENEGNFMTFNMGQKQWDSLVELCVSLCESCNINPKNIRGHREFSNTDCPGDWLFSQLPRLRQEVADKLGTTLEDDQPLLKLGSIGQDVIELQQKLADKGFSPGRIDGDFGENTRQAVIAFQRSVGLTDDGIVGPDTRKALGL